MPVYQYKDVHYELPDGLTNEQALAKIKKHLGEQERSFDPMLGIKSAFAGAGNTADAFQAGIRSVIGTASGVDPDRIDAVFAEMEGRKQQRNQWANPQGQELGFGEKLLGAAVTLPMQIPAALMSPAETGQTAIRAGESLGRAGAATAVDSVGNAVGFALPMPLKDVGKKMLAGGVTNAAQDVLTKAGIQGVLETQQGKDAFQPTAEDAAVAGLVGAAAGPFMGKREKPAASPTPPPAGKSIADQIAQKKAEQAESASLYTAYEGVLPKVEAAKPEPLYTDYGDIAKTVSEFESRQKQEAAQKALDERQAALELEVKRQTTLDLNAAERQRQEQAPTGYAEWQEKQQQDARDAQAARAREQGTQADVFEPYTNMHRQFDQFGNERAPLSFDEFKKTVDQLSEEPGTAYQRPEDLRAAYDQYLETTQGKQGGLFDPPSHPFEQQRAAAEFEARVDAHPMVRAAQRKVEQMQLHIDKLGLMMEQGRATEAQMERAFRDLVNFEAALDTTKSNVRKSGAKSPFKGRGRKQAGAIDPEVFKEGYRALTRALSRLTDQPWLKQRFPADKFLTNQDGTPLVMLHGTKANILGGMVKGQSEGFHAGFPASATMFTQDVARRLNGKAISAAKHTKDNAQVYPLVIKGGNYPHLPFDAGNWEPKRLLEAGTSFKQFLTTKLQEKGYTDTQINSLYNYVFAQHGVSKVNQAFSDVLKRADIDGFFYTNKHESPKAQRMLAVDTRGRSPAQDRAVQSLNHTTSFVTWNDKNFQSVFDTTHQPSFNSRTRRQGGGLLISSEQKQLAKIPGIGNKLKSRAMDAEFKTADDLIAAMDKMSDFDQNAAQKAINYLTKGGQYMVQKSGDHPVVKYIHQKLWQADNQARAEIGDLVQGQLAPTMRALSKQEKSRVVPDMILAETEGVPLTREMMENAGYSAKMIDFVETHQSTMARAFESLNAARAAAGKKPIDPKTAYVAAMFSGDFRKVVYNANNEVIGVVGARTRWGLNSLINRLKQENPEYVFGKEQYFGSTRQPGKSRFDDPLQDIMQTLGENNPDTKALIDTLTNIIKSDVYDFRNVKKHTLAKKGVFGSEGKKAWLDDSRNAEQWMEAQLRYAQNALEWGRLSEAMVDVSKVLGSEPMNTKMPNIKTWADMYVNRHLGINSTKMGGLLDNYFAELGRATGMGTEIPNSVMQGARNVVNVLLLGYLKPGFLLVNAIQANKVMPETIQYLRSKGLDVGDPTGLMQLGEGADVAARKMLKKPLDQFEQAAVEYAKENHVYGIDLIDHSMSATAGFNYYSGKAARFGVAHLEAIQRAAMFHGLAKLLHRNGETSPFEKAHSIVEEAMANYNPAQQPFVYDAFGNYGNMARNLQTYKHNELSRLAMYFREAPSAAMVAAMSTFAFAGMFGFIAFQEADWLIRTISSWMGKPTSLTQMLIDTTDKLSPKVRDFMKHGVPGMAGVDLSNRVAMPDVVPNSPADFAFPGGSKLADIGEAAWQAAKNPNEITTKQLVREIDLGPFGGVMDRSWFSVPTPNGEIAQSRRTFEAQAVRNEADKAWKNFGLTGVNEADQKRRTYEAKWTKKAYEDIRMRQVSKAAQFVKMGKPIDDDVVQKYIQAEGDADSWVNAVETIALNQGLTPPQREMLRAHGAKRIAAIKHLERITRKPE